MLGSEGTEVRGVLRLEWRANVGVEAEGPWPQPRPGPPGPQLGVYLSTQMC